MVPPKCLMKGLNTVFEDQRHYPMTTNCSTFWNLEDSWFGPWRCVLLGEWSNCKQLDLVHKKLVQDLKSKCKVDIDESLLKVILGGSKYAFEGGAYVSQLCFRKGCYIGKAGCFEEEKCLTSPGESIILRNSLSWPSN